jgi:osmoprotectant transport system permease protein
MVPGVLGAVARPPSWSGRQLDGNADVLWHYAGAHLRLSAIALLLGFAVALPLGVLGHRRRRTYPVILGAANALYTIPSLALFVLLGPIFGTLLDDRPLVAALAIYALAILVRNVVEGLRAVPDHVQDAAVAMGYTPLRRLLAVELPMAVPVIGAGLRVAAVSTISLLTVGGAIGRGGLGQLFRDGVTRNITLEIQAGIVAAVVLAVVVDLVLVVAIRLLTPWSAATRRGRLRAVPRWRPGPSRPVAAAGPEATG